MCVCACVCVCVHVCACVRACACMCVHTSNSLYRQDFALYKYFNYYVLLIITLLLFFVSARHFRSSEVPVSTRLCWNCAFLVAVACGYLTVVDCNVLFSLSVGMYQLLTQGTADIVLDSCTDYWDGTTLCSLTDLDRYIVSPSVCFYQSRHILC